MKTVKDKIKESFSALKGDFGYKNVMAAPKIQKVVISVGTGSKMRNDKNKNAFIAERIAKITGQKPAMRSAKKSIAQFKVREGEAIGMSVTLRGEKMYSFIDKLINIALPRTKDFRGVESRIIDDIGNLTLGIREHTIFPETGDEELKDVFGLAVTIVTTAKSKAEGKALFDHIGMPFKKVSEITKKKKK
ncbi:MAG: large subunit ribosomal protein [Patescibacteria group bacterium]|jgi:large subunit ribosomal protein L5|nr:large subunit ribosomal protein [Patescibacteria group bacterium]